MFKILHIPTGRYVSKVMKVDRSSSLLRLGYILDDAGTMFASFPIAKDVPTLCSDLNESDIAVFTIISIPNKEFHVN